MLRHTYNVINDWDVCRNSNIKFEHAYMISWSAWKFYSLDLRFGMLLSTILAGGVDIEVLFDCNGIFGQYGNLIDFDYNS